MPYYDFDPNAIDPIAINDAKRLVPDFGSEINPNWNDYIEGDCVPIDGAQTPDLLWLQADHDPMFYVSLMAANGVIKAAYLSDVPPPPIKPFIPPRPIPAYIGRHSDAGKFVGTSAPEFSSAPSWN